MTRNQEGLLSRRVYLGALAVGMLAPFLPFKVRAQQLAPIKRLVLVFSPNGTVYNAWLPTGTEAAYELSPILAPLERHRAELNIVAGLKMQNTDGDNHQEGIAKLWTGSGLVGEGIGTGPQNTALAGGISIDQEVANAIGDQTTFRSLEFGVRTEGGNLGLGWHRMCYLGASQPAPPESDPYAMFDRIFGSIGLTALQIEQQRVENQSVLDRVAADLLMLQAKMGAQDSQKLEAHLEHVRSIEQRLTNVSVEQSCDISALTEGLAPRLDVQLNDNYPALVKLQTDILALALRCDLTRVASIQWSHSVGGIKHNWLDAAPTGHHAASHLDDDPPHRAYLVQINKWYAEQFAYLLDQLDAVNEGEQTLLDSSLVAWGNELGRGQTHSLVNVPFVLAGAAGGAVPTGRYLRYNGRQHNQLLVAMGQALDLPLTAFGTVDDGTGPLPRLLA